MNPTDSAEMNPPVADIDTLDIASCYSPPTDVYDELLGESGEIRPHWADVIDGLSELGIAGLEGRRIQADGLLHEHGVTFRTFENAGVSSRPWELDVLPLAIAVDEWRQIARGIAQRARLLNLIIQDLYGPRELIVKGLIPPEAVFGHPHYQHAFRHLLPGETQLLQHYSIELARSPDGRWWAMADRSDRTYGLGYALENRVVLARSVPNLIHRCRVERLAPFFLQMQQTLAGLAKRATEYPRIVVLSEGPTSPVYFEDQYLARYLGYTLVEGGDLAVRNDCVALKTLDGLLPVDVILRRTSERSIDPLELGGSSNHGIPGLMNAIRQGNVAVTNAPGTGLFESPVFMPYLARLCRELLGEDLLIPSIATWWCQDDEARAYVLDHLDDLVLKPAFQYSGSEEFIISELNAQERKRLIGEINTRPADFVAQEKIQRSSTPTWKDQKVSSGHVALRGFAVASGDDFEVMPGALVRVAGDAGPMVLSIIAGKSSKDAWVISDQPVQPISLLPSSDSVIPITRSTSQLPSRAADNLFWLGRHLDRAETSARLLRTIADRLAGEGGSDVAPELPALLRVLAAEGQIEPGMAVAGIADQLPAIEEMLPKSLFDESESGTLRSTINELTRLAASVRDLISYDTWRAISRIDESFRPDIEIGETPLADSLDALDRLIIDLAACCGLVFDGMIRGSAWRFLDMGRRIDRCLSTIDLLRHSIGHEIGQKQMRAILEALLDVVDCQSAYRKRYLAEVRLSTVIDLLVIDETNPRSIGFQLAALSDHIDALPRIADIPKLTKSQRLARSAVHEVRIADLDELCSSDSEGLEKMDAFLEELSKLITTLSSDVTRRYLVHSGPPRQIIEDDTPIR